MGRIILEGFMGSGKSTYGRILSKEFLLKFLDTDREIEKAEKCSINDIFRDRGEEYFRDLETDVLRRLSSSDLCKDGVVSLGGGMPCREENRKLMKECGTVVYIKASRELLKERLRERSAKRPMLRGENIDEKVDSLMDSREDLYLDAADIVVETDGKEIYEVINELKKIYNKGR